MSAAFATWFATGHSARSRPGAAQRDEEERYDRSLFERAGELGLTGLPYPEELGGAGMGTFACVLALEEIAAADMGMAVSLSVHYPQPALHLHERDR